MGKINTLFRYYFNLDEDRDNENNVIASITRGISFRGTNLWTLIFAIIIASVGLNVNSTAVIIGAMLISPLMGPIMGIGIGIGIADFDLVRKGSKNLLIAVTISIGTSALYFALTPLHGATSELLARTKPTIWDVFIALTGGLAGVVGATRKEKSNVIPGVAIATALMPPLCTVGFGLATGNWYYALGALYLFFINSVFICVATTLVVRFIGFRRHKSEDERTRKRITRSIFLVVILTAAPSVWLGYSIVRKAVFETNADRFVRGEFKFPNTQIVAKNYLYNRGKPRIELLLIGRTLDTAQIFSLTQHLPNYKLSGTSLVIRQGLDALQEIDFAQIKASVLDEVFRGVDTIVTEPVVVAPVISPALPDLRGELRALFPQVESYSLVKTAFLCMDSTAKADSVLLFMAVHSSALAAKEQRSMQRWLQAKFPADSVQVSFRPAR